MTVCVYVVRINATFENIPKMEVCYLGDVFVHVKFLLEMSCHAREVGLALLKSNTLSFHWNHVGKFNF